MEQELIGLFKEGLERNNDYDRPFRYIGTVGDKKEPVLECEQPFTIFQDRPLLILDSSFNPPTMAHQDLVINAIDWEQQRYGVKAGKNTHATVLLLIATKNADKKVNTSEIANRMLMMLCMAKDIVEGTPHPVKVHIGHTSCSRYVDKCMALFSEFHVMASNALKPIRPIQTYIMGYDTLVRFLDPIYYTGNEGNIMGSSNRSDQPKGLAKLFPFFAFDGEILVADRPPQAATKSKQDPSVDVGAYVDQIRKGSLESNGFQAAWAVKSMSVLPRDKPIGDISSSRVRDIFNRILKSDLSEKSEELASELYLNRLCSSRVTLCMADELERLLQQ